MKKAITYLRYLFDYLKSGDIVSVISSVKYLVNKTSHSNDRIIRTSVGTFFCRKNTNDFQFANYYYEWGVKKYILSHAKEFTVFIDGGACTGDYSILLAKKNLQCIAFEPIADNYNVIVKNLELNNLTGKVQVYQVGLGNENKQARFNFNPINTGASYLDRNNKSVNELSGICTFDSMLSKLNISKSAKILFKLDVEGMEAEALQGSVDFIRQYSNITFIVEDKHTGQHPIRTILSQTAEFEFGTIDEFNIYARKIRNFN